MKNVKIVDGHDGECAVRMSHYGTCARGTKGCGRTAVSDGSCPHGKTKFCGDGCGDLRANKVRVSGGGVSHG